MKPERVRELLNYQPDTGIFTWLVKRRGAANKGDIAGCVARNGYLRIGIDGQLYFAHRMAWLYVHGELPKMIDHVNGVKTDNRISNLRAASQALNAQNRRRPQGSNPYIGISFHSSAKKWIANICTNGIRKTIGRFDSPEDARDAYLAEKRKTHTFGEL